MIPPTDVRKGGFDPDIGFDEPGDLLKGAAEFTVVLRAVDRRVRAPIDRFDHLDRLESPLSLGGQPRVCARSIQTFDDRRCVAIARLKLLKIVDCDSSAVAP